MSSSADRVLRGVFVTLEGGEGAGKSTQVQRLVERLTAAGRPAIATREPGGTPLAERYRGALLSGAIAPFGPAAEALVFCGARIDHIDSRILPALVGGTSVVCDRFIDSTRAYQGALGHLPVSFIEGLERVVVGRARPDLTIMLDLPPEIGLARAGARRPVGEGPDRFERQNLSFHTTLREAFLAIADHEQGRCQVVDAQPGPEVVAERIWQAVTDRLLVGRATPTRAQGLHHA